MPHLSTEKKPGELEERVEDGRGLEHHQLGKILLVPAQSKVTGTPSKARGEGREMVVRLNPRTARPDIITADAPTVSILNSSKSGRRCISLRYEVLQKDPPRGSHRKKLEIWLVLH